MTPRRVELNNLTEKSKRGRQRFVPSNNNRHGSAHSRRPKSLPPPQRQYNIETTQRNHFPRVHQGNQQQYTRWNGNHY